MAYGKPNATSRESDRNGLTEAKMKKIRKANPRLIDLISNLKAKSREKNTGIWRDIAYRLERPARSHAAVNLSRLNRNTSKDDVILVPGKVLATGVLDHPLTVAAFNFSESAADKIKGAGGICLSIEQLMEQNPDGSRVLIMG